MPINYKYTRSEEKRFNKAMKLKDTENYPGAIKILKELVRKNSESPALNGTLGGLYYMSGNYYSSLCYFKKATKLNPKNELSSLGYYHSLRQLGFTKAAFKEIIRYMKIKRCNDYEDIIKEVYSKRNYKWLRNYKSLIEKMNELL